MVKFSSQISVGYSKPKHGSQKNANRSENFRPAISNYRPAISRDVKNERAKDLFINDARAESCFEILLSESVFLIHSSQISLVILTMTVSLRRRQIL